MYSESQKLLEFYEKIPAIETIRSRYATISFFKQTTVYFGFLVLLTIGKSFKSKNARILFLIFFST